MTNIKENVYFKKITYKYRIKKIKAYINGKTLTEVEIEFYVTPSQKFLEFLEVYLSACNIKKIYFSKSLKNKIVLVFIKPTHRNMFYNVLDNLYYFIDYNTQIKIDFKKL